MFYLKLLIFFAGFTLVNLIFTTSAWAWGPAIHTVIACNLLGEASLVLPSIALIIQSFPLQYIYGSMAADFFIGKGQKVKDGHSHNWETGFRLLDEASDDQEAAYAYGFLSHLAADVVAHNYFVPDLIHRVKAMKKLSHLYSEAMADRFIGPFYIKVAKDILSMEHLDCDDLLRSVMKRNKHSLKAKRQLFTQSVKITNCFSGMNKNFRMKKNTRFPISKEHLTFMIELSYRLVKDLLSYPDSSPCLTYDPIGSKNLYLASRNGIISKLLHKPQTTCRFPVDQRLLRLQ